MPDAKPGSVDFQILLALAAKPRHGYAIMQEIARQTAGKVRVGPGSLYGAIGRLLDARWVIEAAPPSAAEDDVRRTSYYRLTPAGRKAASDAARQMADLLAVAASHGLLPAKLAP